MKRSRNHFEKKKEKSNHHQNNNNNNNNNNNKKKKFKKNETNNQINKSKPNDNDNSHLIRSQPDPKPTTTVVSTSTSAQVNPQSESNQPEPNPPESNQLNQLSQSIEKLVSQITIPQQPCSETKTNAAKSTESKVIIKKLGRLTPNPTIASSRASRFGSNGHRQAGIPSSRVKPDCRIPALVLAISRKSKFSVFLKKACQHFQRFKTGQITLIAMGCAVSMCFSLAMAIESNLQIGPSCQLAKSIITGTVVVGDEITRKDQETDSTYQTRNQASIEIQLRIEFIPDALKSLSSRIFS